MLVSDTWLSIIRRTGDILHYYVPAAYFQHPTVVLNPLKVPSLFFNLLTDAASSFLIFWKKLCNQISQGGFSKVSLVHLVFAVGVNLK
jgi:hypothetical protein